jgi:hypothetical protein
MIIRVQDDPWHHLDQFVIPKSGKLITATSSTGAAPEQDRQGRRHHIIRAIPYQDPEQEAERLRAVHEARVKIVPRV